MLHNDIYLKIFEYVDRSTAVKLLFVNKNFNCLISYIIDKTVINMDTMINHKEMCAVRMKKDQKLRLFINNVLMEKMDTRILVTDYGMTIINKFFISKDFKFKKTDDKISMENPLKLTVSGISDSNTVTVDELTEISYNDCNIMIGYKDCNDNQLIPVNLLHRYFPEFHKYSMVYNNINNYFSIKQFESCIDKISYLVVNYDRYWSKGVCCSLNGVYVYTVSSVGVV